MKTKNCIIIVLESHRTKMFWLVNSQKIHHGECKYMLSYTHSLIASLLLPHFLRDFCAPHFRSTEVSDCGKYLIVSIVKACRDNLLYFADLEKNGEITGKIPLTPIVTEFVADYDVNINSNGKERNRGCLLMFLLPFLVYHEYWLENGFPYE